jgi:hypothetical protein
MDGRARSSADKTGCGRTPCKSNFSSFPILSPIEKNSHIGDETVSSRFPIALPFFLHGLKIPLHPLYRGKLSSTSYLWDPLVPPPLCLHTFPCSS